jgi:hypothetical protein
MEGHCAMTWNMWLPVVAIVKVFIVAITLVGGLALYDPRHTIFSFTWKRVLSFALLAFGLHQLISLIFHFYVQSF